MMSCVFYDGHITDLLKDMGAGPGRCKLEIGLWNLATRTDLQTLSA